MGFMDKLLKRKKETATSMSLNDVEAMVSQGLSKKQIIDNYRMQGVALADIERALSQVAAKQGVISGAPVSPPLGMPNLPAGLEPPQIPQMESIQEPPPSMPDFGSEPEETEGVPMPPPGLELPPMPKMGEEQEAPMPNMPIPPKPQKTGDVGVGHRTELEQDVDNIGDVEELVEAIIEERLSDVTEKLDEIEQMKDIVDREVSGVSSRFNELESRISSVEAEQKEASESYNKTIEEVRLEMGAMEKAMRKLVPTLASNIRELKELRKPDSKKVKK